MVSELGWGTVPIVTLVSFTFMGIEGIAEQIEMPFGKHICPHYVAVTLTGPSQALMKVISRWVGLHIRSGDFLLTRRTVHRSLLLGFEGRDKVSYSLFFFQSELLLTYISYIIEKLPGGGMGGYGWDDGQGDD